MILTHQKGRGTKVHLYLDGEYVATTDENCWFDNYISNETDINDEQWQQLLAKINYKKALNKCADYLSRRDYSAKEIKAKLLKTEFLYFYKFYKRDGSFHMTICVMWEAVILFSGI